MIETGWFPEYPGLPPIAIGRFSRNDEHFYDAPFGMSLGVVILFVMARKIAVNLVMDWFVGAVAWHPCPSSE
jgi:hypothetical protein